MCTIAPYNGTKVNFFIGTYLKKPVDPKNSQNRPLLIKAK